MMKYLVPLTFVGLGVCILVSPIGKVPRVALAFGEYKYAVGLAAVVMGCLLAYFVHRQKPRP